MGWSRPNVQSKKEAPLWSPWICLLIILVGLFFAFVWIVWHSPVGGLLSLLDGHWLSLTLKTFAGIAVVLTIYLLWWETQAFGVWLWNEWRRNTNAAWRMRTHQHLFIARHVTLVADLRLFPRLAGVATEETDDEPTLTLLSDEAFAPGIMRFEQLSHLLISQIKDAIKQCYPSGALTVLLQTSSPDHSQIICSFNRLWADEKLPWKPDIHVLPDTLPFCKWNQVVSSVRAPVLILALHYRQPEESLPEFASAILLTPASLLTPEQQKSRNRLFYAMPLNSDAMSHELKELRDMGLQGANKKHLIWYSGLAEAPRQGIRRILNELSIPLYDDISTGVLDFDRQFGVYGGLAGWLMVAAASEMASYGPRCQWLISENSDEAWAVVVGNNAPADDTELEVSARAPFPAGSIMLSLVLSLWMFNFILDSSSLAYSWMGALILLFFLVVTLPGCVFLLRLVIRCAQLPQFKTASQSCKE